MNIAVRQTTAAQQLKIIDCDIHPAYRTPAELHPFMSAALARAHGHLRPALPPWADRPAALPAHDGGRHARRLVSREAARPAPIST